VIAMRAECPNLTIPFGPLAQLVDVMGVHAASFKNNAVFIAGSKNLGRKPSRAEFKGVSFKSLDVA